MIQFIVVTIILVFVINVLGVIVTTIDTYGWYCAIPIVIAFFIYIAIAANGSGSSCGGGGYNYNDDYDNDDYHNDYHNDDYYNPSSVAPHNGRSYDFEDGEDYPRCGDGSPDMRYSENYTHADDDDD